MIILPPDFNPIAFRSLSSALLLEANMENIHKSEVMTAIKGMNRVEKGVTDLLLGKISSAEFLELVDSCDMVGIDDYLDVVEENLEAIGVLS